MQTDGEKRRILLHLYDIDLPVTIPVEEEEQYRNAAKCVTNTMNSYAKIFKGSVKERNIPYMAMVEIALKLEQEKLRTDPTPVYDVLSKLSSEIDSLLDTKK